MSGSQRIAALRDIMRRRIALLDGAMGTMIQGLRPTEEDYRGARLKEARGPLAHHAELFNCDDQIAVIRDAEKPLKGNHDLLSLTRPDMIYDLHCRMLDAGADIVETNTFNATSVSQSDYGLEELVRPLNLQAARISRAAADDNSTPERPRFVAGVIGPTNRTLSISPDVNDPAKRNVTFDTLSATYAAAADGLIEGGADLLLIETIFDTLNAKAAIYGLLTIFEQRGERVPIMISGTITDASGRTLTGQLPEAFYYSVAHARPFSVGLNCALGADQLRDHIATIAAVAPYPVSAHPNAGLPNELAEYDHTPEFMGKIIGGYARDGLINIVGGCCGTTPEHLAVIAEAVAGQKPRVIPDVTPHTVLSGLEPVIFDATRGFVNVGERTNVAGRTSLEAFPNCLTIPNTGARHENSTTIHRRSLHGSSVMGLSPQRACVAYFRPIRRQTM